MSRLAAEAGSAASGAALYGRPYRGVRVSTSPMPPPRPLPHPGPPLPPSPYVDPLGVRYDDRAYQVEVEPPPAYVDGYALNERVDPEMLGCAGDLIAQALHMDSRGRDDLLRPVLAAMTAQERQTLVSVYQWPAERVETAVGEPAADGVTPERAGGAS